METILVYEKNTGIIQGAVGLPSLDYFHKSRMKPVVNTVNLLDNNGVAVGTAEVPLIDPEFGQVFIDDPLPEHLGIIYVSTKSESDLLSEEIEDFTFSEKNIEVLNSNNSITITVAKTTPKRRILRKINDEGKVELQPVMRKRILSEHTNDAIADLSLGDYVIDDTDFSAFYTEISNKYKIEVSQSGKKTLVLRG